MQKRGTSIDAAVFRIFPWLRIVWCEDLHRRSPANELSIQPVDGKGYAADKKRQYLAKKVPGFDWKQKKNKYGLHQ